MSENKASLCKVQGSGILVEVRIEKAYQEGQKWRKITAEVNIAPAGAKERKVRVATIRQSFEDAKTLKKEYLPMMGKRVSIWGGIQSTFNEEKGVIYTNIQGKLFPSSEEMDAPSYVTYQLEGKVIAFLKSLKLVQIESNTGYEKDGEWIDRIVNNFLVWADLNPFPKEFIGKHVLCKGNAAGSAATASYDKATGCYTTTSMYGPYLLAPGMSLIADPKGSKQKLDIEDDEDDEDETPKKKKKSSKKVEPEPEIRRKKKAPPPPEDDDEDDEDDDDDPPPPPKKKSGKKAPSPPQNDDDDEDEDDGVPF